MRFPIVARILSAIALVIGVAMFFALGFALHDGTPDTKILITSSLVCFAVAGLLALCGRKAKLSTCGAKEAVCAVALSWVVATILGGFPLYIGGYVPTFLDACFEAMSGFTTTGSSIMTALEMDSMPRGIAMWRNETMFLGGMGIVVLVIAVMPFLGLNTARLFQAESPGPSLERTSPRVKEMASSLWRVYIGVTVFSIICLMLLGLDFFNATTHVFAAVSTGGFSPHSASTAFFASPAVDFFLACLMLFCSLNFSLHYLAIKNKTLSVYKDSECKFFLGVVALAVSVVTVTLRLTHTYESLFKAFHQAFFHVASLISTTGFVSADYGHWSPACLFTFLVIMMIGGCAGSTAGGMKCIRLQLALKGSKAQLTKTMHPNAVCTVRHNGEPVQESYLLGVVLFVVLYFVFWGVAILLSCMCGNDLVTAISAVTTTLSNVGPGLGRVGPIETFAHQPQIAKFLYIVCMMAGRLELYTMLVLFTGDLWKK